jgi:DNA-binding response OmpR family regulator
VLVEDDADIGRLVEHHLQRAGFATRWFRTATNVIREAENQPPVLFLLDLMLPGIDGFALSEHTETRVSARTTNNNSYGENRSGRSQTRHKNWRKRLHYKTL